MIGNKNKMRQKSLIGLTCFAVAILTAMPFVRALEFSLHNFDDYVYLVGHPLTEIFVVKDSIWMPLTRFSYFMDSIIWGDWWGGFHLTSLIVHSINAVLLWIFLSRIAYLLGIKGRWVPFLAALAWSIHPLRCESVILLSSRKDVLSLFFELIALNLWISPQARRKGLPGIWANSLVLVCFALGACCKPSIMTLPVLCFLIDAFIIRELRPLRYVFPVAMMIILVPFTSWQQAQGGATWDMFNQPLWGRVLGAAAAFGIYVRNELWPSSLAVQCIKTWPDLPRFWLPGLIISAACAFYLYRRLFNLWGTRNKFEVVERTANGMPLYIITHAAADPLLAAVAWFSIAIAPMLGIANFGFHAFADRFTYIPTIGFSIALVWLVGKMRQTMVGTVLLFVVVVALGMRTWFQSEYWENDEKTFLHTLEVDGDGNTNAHIALADWYWEIPHDLEKCVAEFEKAEKQNFIFLLNSFEVYIFALCELKRTDRIPEILEKFEKTIVGFYGHEAWLQAWTAKDDLGPAERCRQQFRIAKATWWLACPETLSLAEEFIDQTQSWGITGNVSWLYLNWKLAEVKHGVESHQANAAKERLLNDGVRMGYIQFRYLRKDQMPRYKQ